MDDIRAAIGLVQLGKLKNDLEQRARVRSWYIEALKDNPDIIIPFANYTGFVSNYIFPIVLKNANKEKRDKVREKLHNAGIQTSIHYPPVHLFSCFSENNNQLCNNQLCNTELAYQTLISLPMYSKLNLDQIKWITDNLYRVV